MDRKTITEVICFLLLKARNAFILAGAKSFELDGDIPGALARRHRAHNLSLAAFELALYLEDDIICEWCSACSKVAVKEPLPDYEALFVLGK